MLTGKYKKFCKDYDKVEGYERALHSDEPYFIHHKQGVYMSVEELKEYGWYFDCPPDCLMWVTKSEHSSIHSKRFDTRRKISEANTGERNPMYGKTLSEEQRQKLRKPHKKFSEETKRRMSEANTGERNPMYGKTPYNKGKTWKLIDGKRVWIAKEVK